MIKLENITKEYITDAGKVKALNGINLSIPDGEIIAITGQSGSGKSSLMNVIGCLDTPTSGKYYIDTADISLLSDFQLSRLRGKIFGFIFQSYNLLPRLTALEQVELPLIYQKDSNRRKKAATALAMLGLAERIYHTPNQLSGGEQQRVAIARSIVINPKIILADEPTGALDTKTSSEVMDILIKLAKEQGITIVLVTHEPHIASLAERQIKMSDGNITEDLYTKNNGVAL
ncbi:MAG: ABC transporter ATP-binding protein [SAR202 cluster bacterium]|nr:macrolide ABC transporter ATP-binding protein [Chloroflexota bacterium]MQG51171.1 ABC transporter ATP-binding protein [SAR202 cluster bacterium]|tara:strand:- start:4385 stop:5077 length:693 start_codon:yes stop_codon:yes gene_type:complete